MIIYYFCCFYSSIVNDPIVELFLDAKSVLGETPVYDSRTNEIVWVDIDGHTINITSLDTRENRVIQFNDFVGAAIPCKSGKNLIAVSKQSIVLVDKATGDQKVLCVATTDQTNRFNDAQCDRTGRLWSGTITVLPGSPGVFVRGKGSLFSYDGAKVKCHKSDLSISNGIGWSPDWTKLYLVDTLPQRVYSFDYNEPTGDLTNQQTVVDMGVAYTDPTPPGESIHLKTIRDYVIPDGLCVDSEGKLWIAEHNGSCVSRWDPQTGQLLQRVPIPARKVTACCFGGRGYDTLYVTTGSVYNTPTDWETHPHSGGVFAVRNLGVQGLPPQYFDDSM